MRPGSSFASFGGGARPVAIAMMNFAGSNNSSQRLYRWESEQGLRMCITEAHRLRELPNYIPFLAFKPSMEPSSWLGRRRWNFWICGFPEAGPDFSSQASTSAPSA